MPEIDIEMLVDQLTLIGLVTREQYREAGPRPTTARRGHDPRPDAQGWLTSWQLERLKKGDPSGFFFGDYKVLFHLAEGTFARVYRGEQDRQRRRRWRSRCCAAVRPDPEAVAAVPQGGRGRDEAAPPQHRPDHRPGPAGQPPLT